MTATSIIEVTFVDAETGQVFLKLKLPRRQLPEVQSTMSLGKDTWLVEERSDAEGTCRLALRKVQLVDPNTILFSLPTVADVIPEEIVQGGSVENALRLHEDDWLQLELVPSGLDVSAELEAIRQILARERQGVGFKKLHLRKLQPPFAGRGLRLERLGELFGAARPVAWENAQAPLKDCFAFTLPDGASLYGQAQSGEVLVLGLTARVELPGLPKVVLVDWCHPP